jgi:translocation and assembly module TamB
MREGDEQLVVKRRRRRSGWRWLTVALLLLALSAVAIVWLSRIRIATGFVEREFARRGVQASYRVTRIGFRTQRIENLVIGNPRRPDLTARWVEVDVTLGFRRIRADFIRARGVRLSGRLQNGKLTLGEVDKLMPSPTGKPFRLPNQRVEISDAAIGIDTPAGRIGLGIEGSGNLAYSFEGRIAALSPALLFGDNCRLDRPRFYAAVRTEEEQPSFEGPLRAERVVCGGVDLTRPSFALEATVGPGFDRARGNAGITIPQLRTGQNELRAIGGRLTFDGGADQVRGRMNLTAARASLGEYRSGRAALNGRYAIAPRGGEVSVIGDLAANNVSGLRNLAAIENALAAAEGTPVEPIANSLAAAVRRVGQSFDARASIRVVNAGGAGSARVERLRATSRSGARITFGGRSGVTYSWPAGAVRVDSDFALSGGGFPISRLSLAQPRAGAPIRGVAQIAPMAAAGARLQLGRIAFTAGPEGRTQIQTNATLSGPFNDGRVEGLVLPIEGRLGSGGFAFGEACTAISFQSLQAGALRLGRTRLPLCPTGRALVWRGPGGALQGGALVRNPRLAGTLGRSPISFAASRVRFSLADPGFSANGVGIRLGRADAVNRLDLASLSGRFNTRGVIGSFAGGDGKLAAVPLLLSEARGGWSVQGGEVAVNGAMTVSDVNVPPRFFPLLTNDFRLMLDNGQIVATGWLQDPENGTRVTLASIRHDLRSGRGNAVLDVPGIRFDGDYQPEELTRLTTGVVALVNGVLKGSGQIRWGPEGTTSTGSFSTQDMSLAAAFGPIEGLSTTINFTDLLGLATAPGQLANVGVIRTGIDVFDGNLRYQLLPGQRVRVEAGRWPFAGGELVLEETILDFSRPSTKRLVFRVVGLDAARFISQMEFSNITATGTFDGTIPMEFDQTGGRIVGGRLVARPEGGTLSYIGELTDKQLGVYGKLAFDALKSLRYSKLTINLDGDLAGEFVAGIELDGVARDPALTSVWAGGGVSGMVARRALGQLAKIPFEFNITIRGPFRALIATARSLEDPSNLIQSALPAELRKQPALQTVVQPQESEIVR